MHLIHVELQDLGAWSFCNQITELHNSSVLQHCRYSVPAVQAKCQTQNPRVHSSCTSFIVSTALQSLPHNGFRRCRPARLLWRLCPPDFEVAGEHITRLGAASLPLDSHDRCNDPHAFDGTLIKMLPHMQTRKQVKTSASVEFYGPGKRIFASWLHNCAPRGLCWPSNQSLPARRCRPCQVAGALLRGLGALIPQG